MNWYQGEVECEIMFISEYLTLRVMLIEQQGGEWVRFMRIGAENHVIHLKFDSVWSANSEWSLQVGDSGLRDWVEERLPGLVAERWTNSWTLNQGSWAALVGDYCRAGAFSDIEIVCWFKAPVNLAHDSWQFENKYQIFYRWWYRSYSSKLMCSF